MRWLCPKCQRAVSLADEVCPFCGGRPEDKVPETVEPKPAPTGWADVMRGLRFGAGFMLGVSIVLFALGVIYLLAGRAPWMDRLLGWLGRLFQ